MYYFVNGIQLGPYNAAGPGGTIPDGAIWAQTSGFYGKIGGSTFALGSGGGGTDITYTASTRTVNSSTGAGFVFPLFTATEGGLVPLSGGGTTNFLRADGTFAAPPTGSPGGSNTHIQFNNSGAFGGSANLTWDGSFLNVVGNYRLGGITLGVKFTRSATAPSSPIPGDRWLDTVSGIMWTWVDDGSSPVWVELPGGGTYVVNLTYNSTTRDVSAGGTAANLPLFTSALAGLAPLSGGGITNFLRADGTWAAPAGGGGTPGGSNTQIQFNDAGAFGGDADFTWDKTNNVLTLGPVGGGVRIRSDYTNATIANRTLFQSSVTNDPSAIGVIPNGTASATALTVFNNSTPTDSGYGSVGITGSEVTFDSCRVGSGTSLPMVFRLGSTLTQAMRIQTNGNVTIGTLTTDPGFKLRVEGSQLFSGNASRMLIDTNNGTITNRFAFQESGTNLSTGVYSIPNGTNLSSGFYSFGASTFDNAPYVGQAIDGAASYFRSSRVGTGTALPLYFQVGSGLTNAVVIQTNGRVNIGPTTTDQGVPFNVETLGRVNDDLLIGSATAMPATRSSVLNPAGNGRIQFGTHSLLAGGPASISLYANCYYDSGHVLRRRATGSAAVMATSGGSFAFYASAASGGAADDDIGTTLVTIANIDRNTFTVARDLVVSGASIVQNSQSVGYTLTATDANKHIYHPSADTTARTWTIPSNASVPFAIGTAVTFVNDTSAGAITIAITTDTMVLAGPGTTGSRTLAASGVATAIKMTATRWMISGTGLT